MNPAEPAAPAVVAQDLRALVSRLRRKLQGLYDRDGLTPSQTALVSRLGKSGPQTASELAVAESVRPQSIAATLAVLDERGLVVRTPDPHDGRRHLVHLSDAGRRQFEGSRRANQEWLARAFDERFTKDERRTVADAIALLERLVEE
ncbi:MarR family winged helix-turn-helix transcriptional regulator [Luteimicrobium subarcticum]|uniref:DNA-binding MarR family transcriptional regulator n=1 Tax=Luteimicrobium subarcticum TaxID=620910 RepID=A0A2M8WVT5_9MICO|nr:MarR family transcriptional regulator [Luteimicrobium subarcticum]PJI95032.1 DNA-binding MarR family transcriptional regulator [Luteimicrobium subarcticum]